jgi:hypothetical protein
MVLVRVRIMARESVILRVSDRETDIVSARSCIGERATVKVREMKKVAEGKCYVRERVRAA